MPDQSLIEVFDDVVYENNAQEVFKKLYDLDNLKDRLVARWIWELIQNARGNAGSQNQLQIEVLLENEHLIFRHNGAPFKKREIAHLIFHGSSKHDPKDIGKFGSGFITTHLISRCVTVRGSLDDGRHFDFVLNREGTDAAQLLEAMEKSKSEFLKSVGRVTQSIPVPFTTEYTYPMSDAIREVVLQGIQALRRSAAYIFAFNPMLQRLKISTLADSVDLTQIPCQDTLLSGARRLMLQADGKDLPQSLIVISTGGVEVAMALDSTNGQPAIDLPSGIPRLFVAFPLNNTENFGVPLVLNSESFAPQEGRDGIYLGTSVNETNASNQALFVTGLKNIVNLVSQGAQKDWSKVADVTAVPEFATPSWAKGDWLRSQLRNVLVEGFRNQPLLRTVSGNPITPKSAWIPVNQSSASSSELWRLTEKLTVAASRLPRSNDQEAWGQSLQSWMPFLKDKEPNPNEIWSVEKLAAQLESLKSVTAVTAALQKDTDAMSWINEVHALIVKAGCFELFRQRALIPNQQGDLVLIGKLQIDGAIDTSLKEIAELLGMPVRASLIHPDVITNEILADLNTLAEEKVLSQSLEAVRVKSRDISSPNDTFRASVDLLVWILEKDKTVHLENYPVFSREDSDHKMSRLHLRANAAASEKWLAPVCLWPDDAKPYSDLFYDSLILHPDYAQACGKAELWKKLQTNGYLHLGPFCEAESKVSDFLPDEPLSPDEEKSNPTSETAHIRSQIPFFSGDDHCVLNRARGGGTRAIKVLKFLFDFILPADPKAFEKATTKCDNGKDHNFYRAGWLTYLRNRWVPVGEGRSEPTAQSMASLLAAEPELLKRLGDHQISQLFTIMGASPADLLLRTVGKDDPDRMSLIQSLTQITSAVGNDIEKVKVLAGAIEQDSEVYRFAVERQQRRETIKRNQALGALVESLFKVAFKDTGLKAERTGPGHDYYVAPDDGEEEDAGQIEISGPKGKVYVEIKATTTIVARMSVKQVREAVANKDRYFLCVVSVSNANLDVDDFKAKARFVVNIGELFQNLWSEYNSMQSAVSKTSKYDSGLAIEVTDQQVKFRVDDTVWQSGKDFASVLAEFQSRLMAI